MNKYKKQTSKASYTFCGSCDSCDMQPILKNTHMCAVCTFGEADSMWEWLDDTVVTAEHKAVRKYLIDFLQSVPELVSKKGHINTIMATLLHLDEHALDRIEVII